MTSVEQIGSLELTKTVSDYKWTLSNFSSLNESTRNYKSEIFLFNSVKWRIILYYSRINKNSQEYISVTLVSNIHTTVDCEVTAMLSSSTRIYKTVKFKYAGLQVVIDKFIDCHTTLANLKKGNDILTIHLKFIFSNKTEEANSSYFNLLKDLGSLFKTKENADIILVSNDQSEHKAHKAMLACRSKVFSAMFQHNMKESQDNVVKIEDVDNETLEAILRFVYTGESNCAFKQLDFSKKLFLAADKYELNDLKRICINELNAKMNFNNVLDIIAIADFCNIEELKVKARKYFLQNRKEILSSNETRKFLKDLPRNIVEELLCDLAFI